MNMENELPSIIIIAGPARSGKSWFAKSLIDDRWTIIEGADWGKGWLWSQPEAALVENCNHRTMSKIIHDYMTQNPLNDKYSGMVHPLLIIVEIDFWPHPLFAEPQKDVKVMFSNDFSTFMRFSLEYPNLNVSPIRIPIDPPIDRGSGRD